MNGGSAAKIRFVRCPKCRQVLVEPQDIPVYKCGGCGTHLQVKNRKSNPEVATSGLHETDAAQKNRSDHISEAKESSSSNHEEIFHSPGECSSDQLNGGDCAASGDCDLDHLSGANLPEELRRSGSDRNGSGDFDSKQPGGVNSSHNQKNEIDKNDPGDSDNEHVVGVGSSNEHQQNGSGQNETEDCVDLKVIGTSLSSDDPERGNDSNESPECDHEQPEIFHEVQIQQLESGDCNDEQLGGMGGISTEAQNDWSDRNDSSDGNVEQAGFSYRACLPTKLDEELSPLAAAKPKAEVNEGGIQQNESGAFSDEQLGSVNLSTEAEDDRSDQNDSLDFSIEQAGISYEVCSPTRRAHLKNKEPSPLAGAKSEVEVSDESSALTVTKAELDAYSDSDGTSNNVCSPTRRAHLKNKEPSPLAGAKSEVEVSDESSPLTVTKAELDAHSDSDGTSNNVCSPTRRAHLKNKEPSPLAGAKSEVEVSDESSPLTVTKAELDAYSDSDGTSNNVCSPTRRAHLKNKEPSPLAGAKSEVEVSDESSPLTVTKAELDAHSDSDGTSNNVCSPTRRAHLKNKEPSPLAGAKSEVEVSDESSPLTVTKAELDAYSHSDGTSNNVCSPTRRAHLKNKEPSPLAGAKSEVEVSDESSQLTVTKAELDAYSDSDGTSNNVCSPTRRAHLKNKEPSPLAGAKSEVEVSDESSTLTATKAELDAHSDSDGTSNNVCSPTRRAHLKNKEPSPLAGAKSEVEVSDESSPLAATKAELDALSDSDGTSNNVCSPTRRAHLKNKEPSPLAGAKSEVEVSDESSQLTVTKAELDAHSDSDGTSNDVCSPTRRAHLKNKEPSPLAGARAKSEVEVSDESSQLAATKAELDAHSDSDGTSSDDCSLTKLALLENKELSSVEGEKSEAGASNESSQLAGAKALLDASKESGSDFRKSSVEKSVDKEGASVVAAQRPAGESISSNIFVTSPNEQLEKLHETGRHDFDRVQCTDTFKTMDLIDPSSELSDSLIDLSKSPATRSSRAYYDDTVSSYEGTDDQLPDRPKHPFRNTHKQANHAASNERPRSEKFVANSSLGMQHHLKNHASIISDNNHRASKSSKLNHDELVEHTRVAHPARNWRRLEKDEYPSQAPFYQRGFLAGYDNGSPSNQNNNESRSNPYFHSREKAAYTEQEKMKLLEMIYELQDQVNVLNGKEKGRVAPGVTWKDHNPSYNDHLEQVIFNDLDYPRYPGRFRGGSNWHEQSKYSQIPSAEVASNRNQVDHLCCCPQDWRLAQLPPPNLHHNRVFCKAQDHVEFYHSYGSCPSTPQRHADSEFSIYRREKLSDDHRRRDQEVKKYVTKKHHLAKRHLLPLAGGAPFITCFFCFKQLQLPADFLLSKRKYHQLRCGVCLEVLRFSLISRTHLVPYTPTADAPPPSEVDEHIGGLHMRFSASSSASNCPNMDPVSCSEDYGLPFCQSGSTDRDPVQTSLRSAESSLNEHRKNPKEKHELSGPSSSMSKTKKVSSEIEELPRKGGGSPLHRLMGYSSPSRLIYGYEPSCSSWYYPAED
ncbi:uncharacterized protein [Populus alba]|uniref:Uncharacterized protein n=1 Tax=Populus alba TaxID=43335 RepID=A0A4U5P744_POPAL|nr:uncharacterized protein LOC118035328 [Populus alba]TKR91573.1 hypothetical protein D5086_0000221970 [Populus alba]